MKPETSSISERYVFENLEKNHKTRKIYNMYIKRIIDFFAALIFFIILIPVFVLISILIKLNSPGPVFYCGIRTGRFGREFKIFKFRTMVVDAENIGGGTTALNDPRITGIGSFLRKSKLDEIPQLLNILSGDMSFIGPRPELPRYTNQYQGMEKIILDVRPGITDLSSLEFISLDAVVGSENADEAYEKYVLKRKNELRIEYVVKQSLILDLKLFFKTIINVISKIIKVMSRKPGLQYGIPNAKEL